jgi:quinolinate synthase
MIRELPDDYALKDISEVTTRIREIKDKYKDKLVILGHHYQNDEIIKLSDFTGDSFALAKSASLQEDAEKIVFCGVYFMAEAARVLAKDTQKVYLPNHNAGCPMADMATILQAEKAWKELSEFTDTNKVIPVCYMNSSADIKAFCGKNAGIVCTSSNAEKIFRWAFERGDKILFIPDEHLGRNTANKLGIKEVVLYNPELKYGGLLKSEAEYAKVIVWKGFCHVHGDWFTKADVEKTRKDFPDVKIVVHPECSQNIVNLSDANGSTSFIIDYVENSEEGSVIAVATELNLVKRLHDKYKGKKTVIPLKRSVCPNMMKISPAHLLYCLENLDKKDFEINVDKSVIENSRKALQRMLEAG